MVSSNGAATERPRIVVGVDGSEQSKAALRWAARMAAVAPADQEPQIQAVIVWDFPPPYGFGASLPDHDVTEAAEGILAQTVKEAFAEGVPDDLVTMVREGSAAQVLIGLSEGALVTVVGSRGHGGFTGLLIGSVSAKVAEHAHSPVLVVHGDQDTPANGTQVRS